MCARHLVLSRSSINSLLLTSTRVRHAYVVEPGINGWRAASDAWLASCRHSASSRRPSARRTPPRTGMPRPSSCSGLLTGVEPHREIRAGANDVRQRDGAAAGEG